MFSYDVFSDVFSHKTSLPRYWTIQGHPSPNFTSVRQVYEALSQALLNGFPSKLILASTMQPPYPWLSTPANCRRRMERSEPRMRGLYDQHSITSLEILEYITGRRSNYARGFLA